MQATREAARADGTEQDVVRSLMAELQDRIGPQKFNAWFKHGTRFVVDDKHVRLTVPNPFVANWIETHYQADIAEAVCKHVDRDKRVLITIDPALSCDLRKSQRDAQAQLAAPSPNGRLRAHPVSQPIRLRHKLEDFVVGDCNKLAYSAAVAMAKAGRVPFNPLFIHGSCGLGKTHLLQGVCNAYARAHGGGDRAWRYVTAEQFTNEFITGLRQKKIDEFRARYRGVGMLAIDDIHFIAAKKATQEEFLHTFNALETSGGRIVMACDAHPRQVGELNEQLASRFVAGMVVSIQPPDQQTRVEMLKRHAARIGLKAGRSVLEFIAAHIHGSVRELEGTLIKLGALSALEGREISLQTASEALSDHLARTDSALTLGRIEQVTAAHFEVTSADLHSSRRTQRISLARMVTAWLARRHTQMSYPEIGRFMGKNHSSVVLAVGRMEKLLAGDAEIAWTGTAGARSMPARQLVEVLAGSLT